MQCGQLGRKCVLNFNEVNHVHNYILAVNSAVLSLADGRSLSCPACGQDIPICTNKWKYRCCGKYILHYLAE